MEHSVTFTVAAPTDAVWAVISDVERWSEWTASITSVELDAGELRVGATARIKQPRLPMATWTVTALTPGRSFTWEADGPGLHTTAVHVVEPDGGGGSRVTLGIRNEGAAAPLMRLLYGRLTRRYVQMEAEGLTARSLAAA